MSAVQAKPPFMRDWLQAHSMHREEAPVEILSERDHRLICLLATDISHHDDPEIALWLQHDVSDVHSVRAAVEQEGFVRIGRRNGDPTKSIAADRWRANRRIRLWWHVDHFGV